MASNSASVRDLFAKGRPLFRLEATLIGLLCFSAGVVPRLLPALLGLLTLVAAIHVLAAEPKLPLKLMQTALGCALALFVAYLFINATWSPDPAAGFTKAAAVLGLVAAAMLIAASFSLQAREEARVLAKSGLAGLFIGAAFLLVELNTGEAVMRFVNNNIVQIFELSQKKLKIVDGEVVQLAGFVLNANVTSMVLLLVPGLLFTLALTSRRRLAQGALVAAVVVCVALSASGTSGVALGLLFIALALAAWSLKATRRLLAICFAIATIFAVPLGALPYQLGWHQWTWLPPESVAARFYIWKYTADKVYERPITGIGIRGTRSLRTAMVIDPETGKQTALTLRPGRHAHNVFLQTWLELGAIGAMLLLGVGLAALWQMRSLPPLVQGGAYGLFATCCGVGMSGFDLWQTWVLAAVAFAWGSVLLPTRLALPPADDPRKP